VQIANKGLASLALEAIDNELAESIGAAARHVEDLVNLSPDHSLRAAARADLLACLESRCHRVASFVSPGTMPSGSIYSKAD
jgi:hypothetical protein